MSVFRRLTIDAYYSALTSQQILVAWALNPDFGDTGVYTFTLQRSLSPTDTSGEWEDIATTVDQPWAYDNRPITNLVTANVYYRVKLVTSAGTYISQVAPMESYWTPYDWSLAREIVRKETMLLQKRTGAKGWLLKRRSYGVICPDCVDPITRQITKSNCTTCFGTGLVGGYYDVMEYWTAPDPSKRIRRLNKDTGLESVVVEQARALAYPLLEGGDVWVQAATNRRFVVGADVAYIAKLRGIPLVAELVLEELPTAHVVYEVPTPCK